MNNVLLIEIQIVTTDFLYNLKVMMKEKVMFIVLIMTIMEVKKLFVVQLHGQSPPPCTV